ncbi:MAG TPA: hypothetical protein VFB74_05740 [Kribbellaceae bacterium]|nr:hypothetical protein [Kribbellaceae bacterium]
MSLAGTGDRAHYGPAAAQRVRRPVDTRKRRRGMDPKILSLASEMRLGGAPWVKIAGEISRQFKVNKLVAMRLAHSWSQRDAAEEWCRRWPDQPKTFKSFSYWEIWPGASGYEPSLSVLIRLANLYECAVVDLVADLPDFRYLDHFGLAEAIAYGVEQMVIGELCPHGCSVLAYATCDRPPDRPVSHRERFFGRQRDALQAAVVSRHASGDSQRRIAADLGISHALVRILLNEAASLPSTDPQSGTG